MTTPLAPDRKNTGLLKVLGVVFGVTIIISNTVGAGILRTPGDVAAALPSPTWFLGVWIAGGLYALAGALTMAELAAMLPKSGGQYVYARRAIGEYGGFVIGWSDWISSSAAAAANAIALGELVNTLWPNVVPPMAIAVAVALAFTVLHWIGVRSGDLSTQILGVIKAVTLLGVAVACLVAPPLASASEQAPQLASGLALAGALVIAMQGVLYTYDGWTGFVYFGGEIKDSRHVSRAMALGVMSVILVYLALNIAFLHTLGIAGLAGEKFAARAAAVGLFGTIGDRIVSAVIAVSLLSLAGAVIMLASRVPYAMADDGLLPRAFTRVNRGGTPDIALFATSAVTLVLIVTGTFASVLALAAFFYVMQYGVSFASLFILRIREPDLPRPYRAPGYPFIPALVLLGAIAFIAGSIIGDRTNSIRSILVIVASYPVFRIFKWFRDKRSTPSE